MLRFPSTRPVWARRSERNATRRHDCVSIHAPRVGRDDIESGDDLSTAVSIHAPRVGRDSKFQA